MTNQRNFRLIVSVASRSGISQAFAKQIAKLEPYAVVAISGISDVALARNIQLTETEQLWEKNAVILMLDDDIDISETEKVIELIDRTVSEPGSGLYVDKNGEPTCGPMPGKTGKWLAGLGVYAIPVECLEELKARSVQVTARGKAITCYTSSRPINHDGKWEWSSEDYTLSYLLGGVNLHTDLQFGHFKTLPLHPSPALVEKLSEFAGLTVTKLK